MYVHSGEICSSFSSLSRSSSSSFVHIFSYNKINQQNARRIDFVTRTARKEKKQIESSHTGAKNLYSQPNKCYFSLLYQCEIDKIFSPKKNSRTKMQNSCVHQVLIIQIVSTVQWVSQQNDQMKFDFDQNFVIIQMRVTAMSVSVSTDQKVFSFNSKSCSHTFLSCVKLSQLRVNISRHIRFRVFVMCRKRRSD